MPGKVKKQEESTSPGRSAQASKSLDSDQTGASELTETELKEIKDWYNTMSKLGM